MKKNKVPSLYIHIPFCNNICDYCDFTKLQYFRFLAEKYLVSLKKELSVVVKTYDLDTIYVGGGTPTSLEDDLFLELLEIIKPYSKNVKEYTFEANPESLSLNKIKMLKKYGVNRVSIGVESTDDKILKSINRHHTFEDVEIAVSNLKKEGIDNINLDLILGLPNVSLKMLKKDIENILSLEPKHISTYSLTVHPHTIFYLNKIEEPNDQFSYEAYKMIHDILLKHGYEHYEVSNFAKLGYRSEHNLTYWRNEEYYAVGLSASGYIDNIRYKNTDNLDKYLKCNFEKEKEIVTKEDLEEYFIILNLRTLEGLDLDYFNNIFNKDLYKEHESDIDTFIKDGLLIFEGHKLIPTFEGMMLLDRIIIKLI